MWNLGSGFLCFPAKVPQIPRSRPLWEADLPCYSPSGRSLSFFNQATLSSDLKGGLPHNLETPLFTIFLKAPGRWVVPAMAASPVSRLPRGKARRDTSSSQLLRKRETDRLAQRATRERTKHRIEHLEQEIKRLKSQDQNSVVRELIETTEKQQKRNEELEGSLLKVLLIVQSACKSIQRMRYTGTDCCRLC